MKKILAPLLFALLLGGGGGVTAAYADKTLVVCKTASPAGFDPAQYGSVNDLDPSAPIFDRLVAFKSGTTQVVPNLATKWEVSKDGLTYTFTLRKGVKFHTTDYFKPTRDFNADDVVFTFSRSLNPRHLFRLAYPGEFPDTVDPDENLIKIVKVDPYTVQFVLRKPEPGFLNSLTTIPAGIYSFEYAQQLYKERRASEIAQKPIGTGPFILKRHTLNQEIRYIANKHYWDKRPGRTVELDGLVFAINNQVAVHAKKMLAGECHLGSVPPLDFPKFEKDKNFIVTNKLPVLDIYYIAYNVKKTALKKLLVRQALDMAIDKNRIIKIYHGLARNSATVIPPTQFGFDESIKDAPYNPAKAKLLLKQAGYPKGFKLNLFIVLNVSQINDLLAQIIQDNWTKIGVKVKLVSYESGEFFKRAKAGEHDAMFVGGRGTTGIPINFLVNFKCIGIEWGSNLPFWCNKSYDSLVDRAQYSTNLAEQIKFAKQAQQMIKRELPLTPLVNSVGRSVRHKSVKYVKGYVIPLISSGQFTGITLE